MYDTLQCNKKGIKKTEIVHGSQEGSDCTEHSENHALRKVIFCFQRLEAA
jgi:hypothetical protein